MDYRLKFIKLAGRWFVHLPNYPGPHEDLEMVMGADSFCQQLDKHNTGLLTVYVDTEPKVNRFTTQEYIFKFDEYSDVDGEIFGAYYLENNSNFKIWLCNVTKYLFGEFPKIIYIRLC